MTKVKILRHFPYSPDGIRVERWPANSVRVVDDVALAILIDEGACEILENKAIMGAPENKGGNVTPGKPPKSKRRPRKG